MNPEAQERLVKTGVIPSEIHFTGRPRKKPGWYANSTFRPIGKARRRKDGEFAGKPALLEIPRTQVRPGEPLHKAGDSTSLDDLLKYAAQTPEFSSEYLEGGRKFGGIQLAGDFLDFIFKKSESFNPERDSQECPPGCHIERIDYVERWELMRVTFRTDGTMIVYTRVPYTVARKLMMEAKSGTRSRGVDGEYHHDVGIDFWNLVRIRETRHGIRYPAIDMGQKHDGARNGGYGYGTMAASLKATVPASVPEAGDSKSAKAYSAGPEATLNFLSGGELSAADEREARISAGDIIDMEGTVAYELFHGDKETRVERARKLGEEMIGYGQTSPRLSEGLKRQFREQADEDGELGEALFAMEKFLIRHKLWPLMQ